MEGNANDDVMKGIIPRSIESLFEFIANADDTMEFTLKISYIEIYMERIRDLLDNTKTKVNLPIREHKDSGIFIADVTEEYVTSIKGILRLMHIGELLIDPSIERRLTKYSCALFRC
jgi:kinesin family member 5